MEEPCSQKGGNRTSTCARSRATSFATIRAAREAGARPRRLRAGWEPLIESRAQRACGSDRRCRSPARARRPSRDVVQEPIASVDAHTPPAWRGGRREAVRRAARNGCRPSQPRHAHHSMCNARVLGKTEAPHSLRHISPRTQLAPSHAMPYHTSLREHRRPLGGKSGCRLPIAEPIADRRLYDCRVSSSCVIMCSCLPSSRLTRA